MRREQLRGRPRLEAAAARTNTTAVSFHLPHAARERCRRRRVRRAEATVAFKPSAYSMMNANRAFMKLPHASGRGNRLQLARMSPALREGLRQSACSSRSATRRRRHRLSKPRRLANTVAAFTPWFGRLAVGRETAFHRALKRFQRVNARRFPARRAGATSASVTFVPSLNSSSGASPCDRRLEPAISGKFIFFAVATISTCLLEVVAQSACRRTPVRFCRSC